VVDAVRDRHLVIFWGVPPQSDAPAQRSVAYSRGWIPENANPDSVQLNPAGELELPIVGALCVEQLMECGRFGEGLQGLPERHAVPHT
jgi:protein involved in polysaccharide export with SLBB domain